MKITEAEVRKVADLAQLALTGPELERMARDMNGILEHIDQLNELDTAGVAPMSQVLFASDATATLREDVERAPLSNADAVANAPVSGQGYFKVPKVIER